MGLALSVPLSVCKCAHHVPLCLRVQSPLAVTCWLHVLLCSPRPPLPLSAIMTEEEAATLIQAGYRGYRVSAHASKQRLQCMSVCGHEMTHALQYC